MNVDQMQAERLNLSTFETLLESGKWEDTNKFFVTVCQYTSMAGIRYMVDRGANPRYNNDEPFVMACLNSSEVVRYFINEHGVNINAHDGQGIINAIYKGKIETIKILLDQGIPVTENMIKSSIHTNIENHTLIIDLFLQYSDATETALIYFKTFSEIQSNVTMPINNWFMSSIIVYLPLLKIMSTLPEVMKLFRKYDVDLNILFDIVNS